MNTREIAEEYRMSHWAPPCVPFLPRAQVMRVIGAMLMVHVAYLDGASLGRFQLEYATFSLNPTSTSLSSESHTQHGNSPITCVYHHRLFIV